MSSLPLASGTSAISVVNTTWISIAEAASRSGTPERTLRRRCAIWRNMGRATLAGGEWKIDPTVDDALLRQDDDNARAEVLDLRQVSAAKRSNAAIRREIVADAQSYVARRIAEGLNRVEALREFVARHGRASYTLKFSFRSLYRWLDKSKHAPLGGLVDRRGLSERCRDPDPQLIHIVNQRWLHPNRPAMRLVYDELRLFADRKGLWCWGSYRSFCRWISATYPKAMVCLNREGEQAYRTKHEPSFDQDPDAFSAGELYVGDHHEFRCIVRFRGRLIRPWVSAWMDQRSLLWVGYSIVPSPNQHTVLSSFKHAAERYGPPSKCLMDNGRDYSGYSVAGPAGRRKKALIKRGYLDEAQVIGLMQLTQVEPIFALPESPNAKIVERFFQPIEEEFVRSLPNYCGSDPADRPHDFEDRVKNHPEAFPEFDDFVPLAARWIDDVYNLRPRSGKYCQGRAPLDVFHEKRIAVPQLADPRVLDLFAAQWSLPIKVGKSGIRFNNLCYGSWDPQVIALHGERVRVSYDPNDIGQIGVWTMDHRFICRVRQNELHNRNATDTDRREGFRMKARLKKAMQITREHGHLDFASNAQLALAAQSEAAKRLRLDAPPAERAKPERIRLVQTPLDGQLNNLYRPDDTRLECQPAALAREPEDLLARLRTDDMFDDDLDDLPPPSLAASAEVEEADNDVLERLRVSSRRDAESL